MSGRKGMQPGNNGTRDGDANKGAVAVTSPAREFLTENAHTWMDAQGKPVPAPKAS